VCYLDNVLRYSTTKEEHEQQVCKVLELLPEIGLSANAEKCHFGVTAVRFLGFVTSPNGIGMEMDCIIIIKDWPTRESIEDVQVLLRFTNYYWWYIRNHAKVTTPISDLLMKVVSSWTPKQLEWEWTCDATIAFQMFIWALADAPILHYCGQAKPIIVKPDATGFPTADMGNQYDGFEILRLVNFCPGICTGTTQNTDMYNREVIAIVETMKQCCHYLEGANNMVL
jgi:hypothetical protein